MAFTEKVNKLKFIHSNMYYILSIMYLLDVHDENAPLLFIHKLVDEMLRIPRRSENSFSRTTLGFLISMSYLLLTFDAEHTIKCAPMEDVEQIIGEMSPGTDWFPDLPKDDMIGYIMNYYNRISKGCEIDSDK